MENELSYQIIGSAIEVHRVLGGPGLLESIYQSALCHELKLQGSASHEHSIAEGLASVPAAAQGLLVK